MTAWTDHVKTYCAKKGISYKEGLKDPECKKIYHDAKTEKKEVDKGNKKFKEHQANKDLLIVGTPSISVPDKMLLITDEGEEKVIHPLTRKNKQNIIKFNTNEKNQIAVIDEGQTHAKLATKKHVARSSKYIKAQGSYLETKKEGNDIEREI